MDGNDNDDDDDDDDEVNDDDDDDDDEVNDDDDDDDATTEPKKTNAIDCNDDADTDYSGLDKLATRYSCSSVPVTLTDFSKHGQVDFYKAADSISDYLASIFPRLPDLFYLLKLFGNG